MGSLNSPCTTSYRSSTETIALNCLVFLENRIFLHFGDRQTDRQTDEQMDSIDVLSRSRCRERRLNNKSKKNRNLNTDSAKSKTSVLASFTPSCYATWRTQTKMSASFTLWVRFTKLTMLAVVCRLLYSRTHCCANLETQMIRSVISSICYSTLSAVCCWIPPQS